MSILLDGTGGVTTPGVVNTAGETIATTLSVTGATNLSALTTTGNTILGDASTDTLNVGNGGLVKDASGNVGIGTASPTTFGGTNLHVQSSSASAYGSMLVGSGTYLFEILTNQNSGVMSVGTRSNHSLNISTNDQVQATITTAGLFQFNSGYGSVATAYGCRAWVNFNGEGTVAIRASGNVSSITDNGVGQYTVNFTTAMPDSNYSAVGGGGGSIRNNTLANVAFPNNLRATGSIGVDIQYVHTTAFDSPFVSVSIFR